MKPQVTVIDYGVGNLFSVTKALERVGAEVVLSAAAADIANAQRLVLPGVGAFADGMRGLAERGLIEPIKTFAASGRPFLGICLGMQMMLDSSEEFGNHQGLGLIPGRVVAVPSVGSSGQAHKIPHIGWAALKAGIAALASPVPVAGLAQRNVAVSVVFAEGWTERERKI